MDRSCWLGFLLFLSWPEELASSRFGISAACGQPTGATVSVQLIRQQGKTTAGCALPSVICSGGDGRLHKLSQSVARFYSLHQRSLLLSVIRATPQWRTCPSCARATWRGPRCPVLTLVRLFPSQSLSCSFDSDISYLSPAMQRPVFQDSDAVGGVY